MRQPSKPGAHLRSANATAVSQVVLTVGPLWDMIFALDNVRRFVMPTISVGLPDDLDRFLADIARAARDRGDAEALSLTAEALWTDNEALELTERSSAA